MTKLKIILYPKEEEILRKISRVLSLDELQDDKIQTFFDNLVYTAQNTTTSEGWDTAGLAAIQVGNPIKAFVAKTSDINDFKLFINPQIEIVDTTLTSEVEGCLSIPHTTGKVARPYGIKVTYLNRHGVKRREKYFGWDARVILHEYDHTEGVLFIDKVITA